MGNLAPPLLSLTVVPSDGIARDAAIPFPPLRAGTSLTESQDRGVAYLDRYLGARRDLQTSILIAADAPVSVRRDLGRTSRTMPLSSAGIESDARFLAAVANGLRRDVLLLFAAGPGDRSQLRTAADLARDRDAFTNAAAALIARLRADVERHADVCAADRNAGCSLASVVGGC